MKWLMRSVLLGVAIIITGVLPQDTPYVDYSSAKAMQHHNSETATSIDHIATSARLPNVLLISRQSASGSTVEYSLDRGATWQEVVTTPWPSGAQITIALAPRLDDSVRIIVGAEKILYRTGDYGVSWAQQALDPSQNPTITSLTSSSVNPTLLYAGGYNGYGGNPFFPSVIDGRGYASDDAGVSWREILYAGDIGLGGNMQFSPSPLIAQRVYTREGGQLISDDAGVSWNSMTLPRSGSIVADSKNESLLYSYRSTGGIRSANEGATWTEWRQSPQRCSDLLAHPAQSEVLFLVCGEGVYRSTNGGDSWQQIVCTPTTAAPPPLLVADHSSTGRLLLAHGGGLWETLNDGATWTSIIAADETGIHCTYLPILNRA